MQFSEKIITQLPLATLWTDEGELQARRKRYLDKASIRELLKQTPLQFVVADAGSKLKWVSWNECYKFWKEEVQEHVADSQQDIRIDDFSDSYAYIASEWTGESDQPLILLEKIH